MADSNTSRLKRLPALDLLRFTAATAVVLYHYISCFPTPVEAAGVAVSAASAVTRYGYLGVDLFFIISGFVILWSSQNRTPMAFAESRAGRLFPSFWVAMMLAALAIVALPHTAAAVDLPAITAPLLAGNATMIPGVIGVQMIDGAYWTLEIEIRFYALVFCLLLLRQMRRVEVWLHLWLAAALLCATFEMPWAVRFLALEPYGPLFAAGCFFYLVLDKGWSPSRTAGVLVSAALAAWMSVRQRADFITPDAESAVAAPIIVLSFFGLFALLPLLSRMATNARLAFRLGALTYPLYLVHGTIGHLVFTALAPSMDVWPRIAIITALSLALAYLLSITIETHGRKLFEATLRRLLDLLPLPGRRPAAVPSRGSAPQAQPQTFGQLPGAQTPAADDAARGVMKREV
jgi:peptidoglycan/LPS O-acetylase OafA/YrhL